MKILAQKFMAMAAVVLCALMISCEKAPPREYAVLNTPAPDQPDDLPLSATLIFEVIQVNSAVFENWITQNTLIPDAATPLRKAAQSWMHEADATLAETLTLSVKSGGSSRISSEQLSLSTEEEGSFLTNKPGISMEASITIDPDLRVCSVQLNPTLLSSDESTSGEPQGNRSHWNKAALTTNISLPEMAYGFLGSCAVPQPLSSRKRSSKRTSLFFLRADTNLPPQSATTLTSQL